MLVKSGKKAKAGHETCPSTGRVCWLCTAVRWGRGRKKALDSQGGRGESWALKQVNHGACGVVFITGRLIHQGYVKCYSRLSAALLNLEDWKVVLETFSISFLLCFWNTMRKETETRKGCARGPVFCQSSHLLSLTWWVQSLLCPRLPVLRRWGVGARGSWWLRGLCRSSRPGTQQGDLHPARAVVPTPEPWILPAGCLCQQTVVNGLVVEEELAHMLNQQLYFLEIMWMFKMSACIS